MKPTTRSLIKYRGEECLNCGTPLDIEDKYCHQCGQLNSKKQLALKDFFGEFFSNIFSYDSRIWRTIKHLLFKPGFVSKQFISGKRLSYANPFRFFLSVCIVFFLMIQAQEFVKIFTEDQIEKARNKTSNQDADIDVGNGLMSIKLDDVEKKDQVTDEELEQIENSSIAGKLASDIIRKEQETQKEKDSLNQRKSSKTKKKELKPVSQAKLDSLSTTERFFLQTDYYSDFYGENKIADSSIALEKMEHDNSKYNKAIYDKVILMNKISEDASILTDIILPKLPIFLFLFTPILTLFLWLLYIRRDFTYMEHLIFAFNTLTFVFLSMILLFIIKWITLGYINLTQVFFWFIGPFYFYKALRNFYGQKRLKTIIKFLLVSFIFVIGLMIGTSLLLLVGIALY
ncbi:uncharacterized protein DUF3667 [Nonlabens dokdonensis]|uniref:DUF3667 domain-containing protein n=2 Tax=Nonlabens dokdonensis TaxID=328515 RepID=L7WAT7_NONDD|nr:DUF3667 domain-containing protein [Nonlabens dokdonensis]AGC76991.1 hypothetical protein DDD_1864 [Nonlabens dokdonensis DSW-6]PZX36893.1 uncharacterized protein DUF3667 [Nonlabens dokdonensis]